jgi:hypothetical protein
MLEALDRISKSHIDKTSPILLDLLGQFCISTNNRAYSRFVILTFDHLQRHTEYKK